MRIGDKNVDKIYIIGQGLAYVYQHYNFVKNVIIGEIGSGSILNVH